MFQYKKLGKFTFHVIVNKNKIKPYLLEWIGKEWERDHEEFPDQQWTLEWLNLLPHMKFKLLIVDLGKINPRDDLMNYRKNNYSFLEELNLRVEEMEEWFLRGSSIEPLIVNNVGWELMDGYTRFMILKKHKQKKKYAYVGF